MSNPTIDRLAAIRAKITAKLEAATPTPTPTPTAPVALPTLTLNENQLEAVRLAGEGLSFCLTGAAGTGKTASSTAILTALIDKLPRLTDTQGHKNLLIGNSAVWVGAFTRRATRNIREKLPAEVNCCTVHKLLEFAPEEVPYTNAEGEIKTRLQFMPRRNKLNPLPAELNTLIFEESSMLGTDLFNLVLDALPNPSLTQFIFIGDINQLSPVFGHAILGFKQSELPCVRLTHVYRQALESPIIRLAHHILSGKPLTAADMKSDWQIPDKLTMARFPLNCQPDTAEHLVIDYLENRLLAGTYNPRADAVLIPFNKKFGTIELGRAIATMLDTHNPEYAGCVEIVAGFERHYFARGDYVLFDSEYYLIHEIKRNPAYSGTIPARTGAFTRYGSPALSQYAGGDSGETVDDFMTSLDASIDAVIRAADSGVTNTASHVLLLTPVESDDPENERLKISQRGDFAKLTYGYCSTVHKFQGLQAARVFFIAHKSHNVMLNRELLYTAVTRAANELIVICDAATFVTGIQRQQIKGETEHEKAEYFAQLAKQKLEEKVLDT